MIGAHLTTDRDAIEWAVMLTNLSLENGRDVSRRTFVRSVVVTYVMHETSKTNE